MSVKKRVAKLEERSGATISYICPIIEPQTSRRGEPNKCKARWTSQAGEFEHGFEQEDGEGDDEFEWRVTQAVHGLATVYALPSERLVNVYPGAL